MNRNREIWQRFIAIEGIDGSGKTTFAQGLSKALIAKHIPCKQGFEPTNGTIGLQIRQAIASKSSPHTEEMAQLFAADRHEHLYGAQGIQDVLSEGAVYITDRYLFSSLAYQSQYMQWDLVDALNSEYPLPAYLIYLEIPVDVAMKRLSGRTAKDSYENLDFQHKVSAAFEWAMGAYSDKGMDILVLNALRPLPDLIHDTLDFLSPLIHFFEH